MLDDPCSRNGGMDWDSLSSSANPSKDNPQDGLEAELRQQIASSQQTVEELRSSLEKERNQKAQAEARLEAAESYRTEQDQLHEKHLTTSRKIIAKP